VLEVGLGGRFDSTNVIDSPLAAVITTISYDHMAQLGDTLDKIAFEKAGIIKRGTDVVLYPHEKGARLHKLSFHSINIKKFSPDGQEFDYGEFKSLKRESIR